MPFRRSLCTQAAARHRRRIQWPVKQVTKSNFSEALAEIKACILNSDYVAVSFKQTGGHSAPWHKILPIDTAETAYFKAKHAAERFQILQFAVCPFSVKASKLIAHPYNFHLFPRDELKVGMPSYSFSCQSSYLTAMAQEGFDFNACIYNGISYLSKAQESATNVQIGHLSPSSCTVHSSSVHSVADSLFTERIRSRVKNWIRACKDSNKTEDALISSLRKLISGSEVYGSRPSLNIDVCSECQIKLALETLKEFVDVVPLQLPKRGAGVQAVRAVLTSSQEDKNLLEKELQHMEQEQRERVLGFREVIDLISTSQRPVVVHNSLNDFAFIHSKFLAPLPLTMDEFRSSLHLIFPHILDVNHLMKEIGPFEKMNNMPAAISYLERRFSGSIDMDISSQDTDKVNIHGHNVLRVCHLFVKLCSILKISPEVPEDGQSHLSPSLPRHSNIFNPCSSNSTNPIEDDVRIWTGNSRTISINNLVFLWGFESGISARSLKDLLCDTHDVFSEEFDVRMLDRTCAVVVFWTPGFAECFLRIIDSGEIISTKLTGLISGGLKAAGYETYKRVCESGLRKSDLADCLDQAMDETEILSGTVKSQQEQPVIYWNNDEMINLNDL
ncbi:poly(A)-specific ribonuclease PARN-like isoform X2 [Sesamum indicum]|uniref:Poly(A)-specific ribonuclease PARN-like isoform X2 n=1 Tax=Sesamum indicum TaxID=4182 RepID=A0A6I9TZU1_SESIN|nr:poly(A)-specific ribonuclease PARN-like isoform X2 [Sesamum indicum]